MGCPPLLHNGVTPRSFLRCAGRNITIGQELRISYGPLSDGELLLTYGFVEALEAPGDNPNNKVVLAERDVRDAGKVCSKARPCQLACLHAASDDDRQSQISA